MSKLTKKLKYALNTATDVTTGILNGEDVKCSKKESQKRIDICDNCPLLKKFLGRRQCGECGCFLDLKVTLANAKCPKDHW